MTRISILLNAEKLSELLEFPSDLNRKSCSELLKPSIETNFSAFHHEKFWEFRQAHEDILNPEFQTQFALSLCR